jgi:hypothetical protein
VLTFLVIGTLVSVIALAAERRGGKLGGLLVGIPSASALSFFFAGLYISPLDAANATNAFPVFVSLTGLFLLIFGFTARKGFAVGIIASISIWFFTSFLVVSTGLNNFELSLVACVAISAIVYYGFRWRLKPKLPEKIRPRHTKSLLLLRFALGGGVVTSSVFMSQIGIPLLSGMSAAFPALSISTLTAIQMNQGLGGTERARGMTMSIMVSIMVMVIPYGIVVHYLYPSLGIIYGTAIAYAVVIAIGIPYYLFAEDFLVPCFMA